MDLGWATPPSQKFCGAKAHFGAAQVCTPHISSPQSTPETGVFALFLFRFCDLYSLGESALSTPRNSRIFVTRPAFL